MFSIYNNGKPSPMGYSQTRENGLKISNFALFSSAADAVELCLFRDGKESCFAMSRTDNIWHVAIEGVELNDEYAFRITGKNDRTLANPQKLMLDPYAKAVTHKPDLSSLEARSIFLLNDERDNAAVAPKGRIVDEYFDWSGDCKPSIPWAQTIVYELNVKGFSQLNSRIPENIRGTYAALAHPENIVYFKSLGITSLELLPVNFFIDEPHLQEKGLRNYWGYNPLAMFVLEPSYAADQKQPLNEFKSMVKALHQAGIEVILDVVFNHTAESEKTFPTFCQRGIDDKTYYWQNEHGDYLNWTGCGNMLNLANDVTRKWVLDCLRYWVTECHVDGFRFDLMGIIDIETLNQVYNQASKIDDSFIVYGEGWNMPTAMSDQEKGMQDNHQKMLNIGFFNDYYRETLKGGSSDSTLKDKGYFAGNMYNCEIGGECMKNTNRYSYVDQSINYVECHDNATTFDKFAISNGDEPLETRKKRQLMLNVALVLSQGIPFIHCGQEFYRSKGGLGNTYNTLDSINAVNWSLVDENQEDIEILKQIIQLRKENSGFRYETIQEVKENVTTNHFDYRILRYSVKQNKGKYKEIVAYFNPSYYDFEINDMDEYEVIYNDHESCTYLAPISMKIFGLKR